ncbi:integrase catalytic domain-containing protein [Trichonephila clavipes]|nr:integrase catalytic domain-containing protein [Trichonephila clavipes]
MELHKWGSSHPELASNILGDYEFENPIETKKLGVSWKSQEDCFIFKIAVELKDSYTKRCVLSTIARLFDPLGLLGPVVARAKIFMQSLWSLKIDWIDELPSERAKEWHRFLEDFNSRNVTSSDILPFSIARWRNNSEACNKSKSRVAPVKSVIMPRLDLCAAVLLAKLMKRVETALQMKTPPCTCGVHSKLPWRKRRGPLDVQEINQAEVTLIRIVQLQEFKKDIMSLKENNRVSAESLIKSLNPFLDKDGVLRVGGRLCNSDLNFECKFPVILPCNHKLTNLIVEYFHLKYFHLGPQALLYQVRQRFWPLRGRNVCRKIVHDCLVCFKVKPITCEQIMGNLPKKKGRGRPSLIFSDNGKTFIGANAELKRLYKLVINPDPELAGFLVDENINWKFLPPRAPNFGGLWEAGVKSFKFHFKREAGNSRFTYKEFLTIMTQIEGILNSRPLTPLSTDIDDLSVLTPAHFLIGRPITSINEPNIIHIETNRLNIYQRLTKIVQSIWKRWSNNYLSTLQQRSKWKFEKDNARVGDLVLIKEDNLAVNKWLMGRLIELLYTLDFRWALDSDSFASHESLPDHECLVTAAPYCCGVEVKKVRKELRCCPRHLPWLKMTVSVTVASECEVYNQ